VVATVLKGENYPSAALHFGVTASSVVKWSQRYRADQLCQAGQDGPAAQVCAGSAWRLH